MDARGGRARHRRAGRAAEARRRDLRQAEARDADLVHGRHAAHRRHRQRPRLLHPAARDRQCRRPGDRRQHLPRPRQRAGRDRHRPRYHDPAALLRPRRRRVAALVPRLGGRLRLDASLASPTQETRWRRRASRRTRWFDAMLCRREAGRAARQLQGDVRHGPRRQHRDPHAASGEGHREARTAGGRRSASDHLRADLRTARTAPTCCRSAPASRRSAPAPPPTARCNGASRWSSRSSRAKQRLRRHVRLARKLGFADEMFKNINVKDNHAVVEDILREINRGGWALAIPASRRSACSLHMQNQEHFDVSTLRGARGSPVRGRLLWPALALLGHAGDEAPRHPHPLRHHAAREGGRRHLPRPLRRRTQRPDPAGRGQLVEGLGDPGRLPGIHRRPCSRASAGTRS